MLQREDRLSVRDFRRKFPRFFKNGNVNNLPEAYRVWKNFLIVLLLGSGEIRAQVWKEYPYGRLHPFADMFETFEGLTIDQIVERQREKIDRLLEVENEICY